MRHESCSSLRHNTISLLLGDRRAARQGGALRGGRRLKWRALGGRQPAPALRQRLHDLPHGTARPSDALRAAQRATIAARRRLLSAFCIRRSARKAAARRTSTGDSACLCSHVGGRQAVHGRQAAPALCPQTACLCPEPTRSSAVATRGPQGKDKQSRRTCQAPGCRPERQHCIRFLR